MALSANSGEEIDLSEGQNYIAEFSKKYPDEVKGFFVGSNQISKILEQDDCIGVRIYNGYDEIEESMNQVLVGVDSKEKDMTSGVILERLVRCPNYCDTSSLLIV